MTRVWDDVLIQDVRDRIALHDCNPLSRALLALTSRDNYRRYGPKPGEKWSIAEWCYRYDTTTRLVIWVTDALNLLLTPADQTRLMRQALMGANIPVVAYYGYGMCNLGTTASAVAQCDNLRMMTWLHEYGGMPPTTVLSFRVAAAKYGNIMLLRYLLALPKTSGYSLGHVAIKEGQYAALEFILQECITTEELHRCGYSLLLDAIYSGNVPIAQLIYRYWQDLHPNALGEAVVSHKVDMVQWVWDTLPADQRVVTEELFGYVEAPIPRDIQDWLEAHR